MWFRTSLEWLRTREHSGFDSNRARWAIETGEHSVVSVGLGLTVSRRLARHMGGDLTYDHDGRETVFCLTLATARRPVPAV